MGLKYFNVFGPNEYHKGDMSSVAYKAFSQIGETGKVKLFKSHHPDYRDGEQIRDFLYIKNAVRMTLYLAGSAHAGGLYNLSSGEANTWLSLVRPIFKALGKTENIEFIEMPDYLKSKYQYCTQVNIAKITQSGYREPLYSLSDSVTDYVQNYLAKGCHLGD